jgi:hypothetical protein
MRIAPQNTADHPQCGEPDPEGVGAHAEAISSARMPPNGAALECLGVQVAGRAVALEAWGFNSLVSGSMGSRMRRC